MMAPVVRPAAPVRNVARGLVEGAAALRLGRAAIYHAVDSISADVLDDILGLELDHLRGAVSVGIPRNLIDDG